MKISNFKDLAITTSRKAVLEIAEAGLEAIDTRGVIHRLIRQKGNILTIGKETIDLTGVDKVFIAGAGKCSLDAAHALEDILGDRISGGLVLYVSGESHLKNIIGIKGTHPAPSDENIRGASQLKEALIGLTERDLVIFIASGGGSTLLCLPEDQQCKEEADVLKALTRTGATIQEVNTVRKHLSLARGGYLAQYAYPARVISLVFSDIAGDDMQFIASGPMVRDITTIQDAEQILSKYNVLTTCHIDQCGLVETPKDEKYFTRVTNILAVSNKVALDAMKVKAKLLGFKPVICDTKLSGEASDVGQRILHDLRASPAKTVLLYGGETTVTVHGYGRGGRNLELALSAMLDIQEGEIIMPVASDGRDNGEYAGAICDVITSRKAHEKNINLQAHLQENHEYPLFREIGSYLLTGDTGSNVSDLVVALKS
jgi:glycerate 2-kinase